MDENMDINMELAQEMEFEIQMEMNVEMIEVKRRRLMKLDVIYDQLKTGFKNYLSCPSLQQLAMIRLVICFWSSKMVRKEIAAYFTQKSTAKTANWKSVELKVLSNTRIFILPPTLYPEFNYTFGITCAQIYQWVKYLYHFTWSTNTDYVNDIVWTVNGTIDKKKSFDLLLANNDLKTNGSLYNLGYNLLLKDDIPMLWDALSQHMKKQYENREIPKLGNVDFQFSLLARRILYKPSFPLTSVINNGMLLFMITENHDLALKFIWELHNTPSDRAQILAKGMVYNCKTDSFYFLLRQSSEREIKRVIKDNPYCLLTRIAHSDRPWQLHFLPLVKHLVECVPTKHIYKIIYSYFRQVTEHGIWAAGKRQFMIVFWQHIPVNVKETVVLKFSLIATLMSRMNLPFLKTLLKSVKKDLVYQLMVSDKMQEKCFLLVINEIVTVEDIVKGIFTSDDLLRSFKKEFATYGLKNITTLLLKDKYNMLLNSCFSTEEEINQFKKEFIATNSFKLHLRDFQKLKQIDKSEWFVT